ncbi:unnamed protein product [Scytosiphon promiscuus]
MDTSQAIVASSARAAIKTATRAAEQQRRRRRRRGDNINYDKHNSNASRRHDVHRRQDVHMADPMESAEGKLQGRTGKRLQWVSDTPRSPHLAQNSLITPPACIAVSIPSQLQGDVDRIRFYTRCSPLAQQHQTPRPNTTFGVLTSTGELCSPQFSCRRKSIRPLPHVRWRDERRYFLLSHFAEANETLAIKHNARACRKP